MIKKSFAREINKAMGKDNLEALKKEIISILEKKKVRNTKKQLNFLKKLKTIIHILKNQFQANGLKKPVMVLEQFVSGEERNIKK